MKSYLVTVLVEFADNQHDYWSEGADETFSIARRVDACDENSVYILGYTQVGNDVFPKYEIISEEGGI